VPLGNADSMIRMPAMVTNPVIMTYFLERRILSDIHPQIGLPIKIPEGVDAVLSLACGAGVQTVAAVFDPLPVIPALNTTFLGANIEQGVFQEMCRGCGDCVLAYTGGICPVARCAKGLFNGPCGGTRNGSCEVREDLPCAWAMIFYRLKRQNKLDLMLEVRTPPDWRPAGGAGPRELKAHIKEP
jgi:hypothetical protein